MVISIDKNGYLETVLNLYALFKVMDNNSTNINKTYNYLSPQIIKHKIDHDIWLWECMS
jgi:hypothetical protein